MNGTDPLISYVFDNDPALKGRSVEEVKKQLYGDPNIYNTVLKEYYNQYYADSGMSYDQYKAVRESKFGNPFKKKDGGTASEAPGDTSSKEQYQFSWGTEKIEQLSGGGYAVSQTDKKTTNQLPPGYKGMMEGLDKNIEKWDRESALNRIRERRKGDYATPADSFIQGYEKDQNNRRTPLEMIIGGDDQETLAEYKGSLLALQRDMGDLEKGVGAIDEFIKEKFGENAFENHEKRIKRLQELQSVLDSGKYTQENINEYKKLSEEAKGFEESELVTERNNFVAAYEANRSRAEQILKADNYATVRKMIELQDQKQKEADAVAGKGRGFEPLLNAVVPGSELLFGRSEKATLGRGIIFKSLAKLPQALGTVMNMGENLTTGDQKYNAWDKVEDFLVDLNTDVESLNPAPTKYSRPIFTTTAKWGKYQVDYNQDGTIQAIRDPKGVAVDAILSDKQKEELQTLPKARQFNAQGLEYQITQTAADLVVQIGLTKGIAAPLKFLGTDAAAKVGVTLSTMGTMAPQLYEEGLEVFDGDKAKASQYALQTGLLVGVASNLFGLESKLAGGKGGLIDDMLNGSKKFKANAAAGTLNMKQIAAFRAKEILAQGLGESFEEGPLETAITRANQYLLGGQVQDIDYNDLYSTAVISFAVGALGGSATTELNPVQKNALYWASQNPEKFSEILKQNGASEEEAEKQKSRMVQLQQQLNAIEPASPVDQGELAYLVDQKNQAVKTAQKMKAASLETLEKQALEQVTVLDKAITDVVTGAVKEEVPSVEITQEEAVNQVFGKLAENAPVSLTDEDLEAFASGQVENFSFKAGGWTAKGKVKDGVPMLEIKKGTEKIRLAGLDIEERLRQMIKPDTMDMKTRELAKEIKPEGVRDDIALFFAEGNRIKTEDFKRAGDPNYLKDDTGKKSTGIALKYLKEEGKSLDQEAQRLAEKWGWDESRVIEEFVDFITQDKPKEYLSTRVRQQRSSFAALNDEELAQVEDFESAEAAADQAVNEFMQGLSPDEATDFVALLAPFTNEEDIDYEAALNELKQLDLNFAGISQNVYDAIKRAADNARPKDAGSSEDIIEEADPEVDAPWRTEDFSAPGEPLTQKEEEHNQKIEDSRGYEMQDDSPTPTKLGFLNIKLGDNFHNTIKKFIAETFTSKGLLNEEVFELNQERMAHIAAMIKTADFLVRNLKKAVKQDMPAFAEHFGIDLKEVYHKDVMNALKLALQDPKLPYEEDVVVRGMTLPESTREALRDTRAHMKALSTEMVALGIVDGPLAVTFMDNMDTYLHRAYRVHSDKNWLQKVKGTKEWASAAMWWKGELIKKIQALSDAIDVYNQKAAQALEKSNKHAQPSIYKAMVRRRNYLIQSLLKTENVRNKQAKKIKAKLALLEEDIQDYLDNQAPINETDAARVISLSKESKRVAEKIAKSTDQNEIDTLTAQENRIQDEILRLITEDVSRGDVNAVKQRQAYEFWRKKAENAQKEIDDITARYEDDKQIQAELEAMVKDQQESFSYGSVSRKGKLGSQDQGILRRRKTIPKELRDLYGEMEDPYTSFTQSIFKMAHLSENAKFLRAVEKVGVGKFLFEEPRPGFTKQIAAEGSKTMSPLNGYRTSDELAEAFENFNKPFPLPEAFWFLSKLAGIVKYNKTILSPVTHIRNLMSNVFLQAANGRININKDIISEAIELSFGEMKFFQDVQNRGRALIGKEELDFKDRQNRILQLVELGIIDEDVNLRETRNLLEDIEKGFEASFDPTRNFMKVGWNNFHKFSQQMYKSEDNVHKIYAFGVEKARYARIMHGKKFSELSSDQQIEVEKKAAKIVRDTMPTYSLVSKNIQNVGRIPFIGTFTSFPYESIRVQKNTLLLAKDEVVEGYKTGNSAMLAAGLSRIMGTMTVTAGALAASSILFSQLGMGEDGEDKIRWVLPSWSRNSVILPVKKVGPEFTYVDLQTVLPQGYLIGILESVYDLALGNPDTGLNRRGSESFWALLRPYLEQDMTFKAMMDVVNNQKNNRKMTSEDDPRAFFSKIEYLAKVAEPGFSTTGRRIIKSFVDPELNYHGRLYPGLEITTALTGIRFSPGNVDDSFGYLARSFADRSQLNKAIYTSEKKKQKYQILPEAEAKKKGHRNMTPEERQKALEPYKKRAIFAWQKMQKDAIRAVADLQDLGGNKQKMLEELTKSGFNISEATAIVNGRVIKPSFDARRRRKK